MGQPVVYLNGSFVPRGEAKLDVEDRAAMFADGAYEVLRYYAGRPLAMDAHVARLRRSLDALGIDAGAALDDLPTASRVLVERNGWPDAKVYWQVSRGVMQREHLPAAGLEPTVMAIAYPRASMGNGPSDDSADTTPARLTAMLCPDPRWHRCDIKSLMLLPAVLDAQKAMQHGYDAAIWHRHGRVTESTAANVMIVRHGELWTHPADQWILAGVTRQIVLDLARQGGLEVNERAFDAAALLTADEVMLTGTTTHVAAVVQVDHQQIGGGEPGRVTRDLHAALLASIRASCGS